MPTTRDTERMSRALAAAGLCYTNCKDLNDVCRELPAAGAALLTEEAVVGDLAGCLQEALRNQPPWSDFPLVVLARQGPEERRSLIRESMNATLVERPVKLRSLLSVLRAVLRSRRHQYEVRAHLEER
jgi:DNA-binding response OmpR family regulator